MTLQEAKQDKIRQVQRRTSELRNIGFTYTKNEQTLLFSVSLGMQVHYSGFYSLILMEILSQQTIIQYPVVIIGNNTTTNDIETMLFSTQLELLDFANHINIFMGTIFAVQFQLFGLINSCTTIDEVEAIVDPR
jgi:hypothetical protein